MSKYRMPAEWERHEATWLSWPYNRTHWPGRLLREVRSVYIQMIRALLPGERVNLLVENDNSAKSVLKLIRSTNNENLIFHKVKTVDVWIRDYGPIFVVEDLSASSLLLAACRKKKNLLLPAASCQLQTQRRIAFVKWRFNAWGRKYKDVMKDNEVVNRIGVLKGIKRFDPGIVLEGGSIDVNGQGLCLTTKQCLLDPNRNPSLSKRDIEGYLNRYLGVRRVIWLKKGIEGDDTGGHVDDVARFVNAHTIVIMFEKDKRSPNGMALKENIKILKSFRTGGGKRLRIVELPAPRTVYSGEGNILPASYANFYIANRVVLVPTYGCREDADALKIFRSLFPERRIVGIDCTSLVHGLGSIHCVTQQQPAEGSTLISLSVGVQPLG